MALFSAGVLAGAYRGGRADLSVTLHHAVSDAPLHAGRLKRAYGQALCNPRLDIVDSGDWHELARVDCPRCREIVARLVGGVVVPG